jgi:cyclic beta-1,2-glucan synthetase
MPRLTPALHTAYPADALPWMDETLIRAELFSVERLEQHAESLARAQPVSATMRAGRSLAGRLAQNAHVLFDAHRTLLAAIAAGQPMTPAGQWLVDNYHVVEAQVREIRADLPPAYYRQLPKLATGPFAQYPRVFGLAWALVAHTDSRFDPLLLRRFVLAYQRVQPLSIGELWAIAITLRIVLVENLRRAARRIIDNRAESKRADDLADAILSAGDAASSPALAGLIAHLPAGPLHVRFAVQLIQRLRDQDPAVTPALSWLEQQLALQGTNADAVVHDAHQNQAAMSVTVRNIITSMRMISAVDWASLFESLSQVDAALRTTPNYALMDFATRNIYRNAIEALARGARVSELDVTWEALRQAAKAEPGKRQADPGHYLIGAGRAGFEADIAFVPPFADRMRRTAIRLGLSGYAGAIAAVTAGLVALALAGLHEQGLAPIGLLLFALLALFPAAGLAVALVNWLTTRLLRPTTLPALELSGGVPPSLRTLVVMPTLLTNTTAIAEQIERLEIHHFASPDRELAFVLLTDWCDAATASAPEDARLLAAAEAGIARLNQRHPAETPRFLLLHRRRCWNHAEGCWMGWERKRGKLHELNRLLRGASDTNFIAPHPSPDGVRYVITLDSDTMLPRETVRRLIGKMAHPLNQPRMDATLGRVVEGYGILQPRVTPSLPDGGEGSLFQQAFSSPGGIDPYAGAVSDVYQDLLGDGSFAGKGIYDVDIFEAALAGRVPENALLSHDLFEGIFARAGLATDVEVIEAFPARYDVAISRQHRWTRGDWQLLPWILRLGLPPLGRWKMLDNLRRSLTAPIVVLGLLAGWQLRFGQAWFWTIALLVTVAVPPLLPLLTSLRPRGDKFSMSSHLRGLGGDLRLAATQFAMETILLADQAWSMTDAIGRTLWRLIVTRRHLMEWTTAEQAGAAGTPDLSGQYRRMRGTVVIAAFVLAGAWVAPPGAGLLALPFALLWLLAPAVARIASRSRPRPEAVASAKEIAVLRLIARRTWRYFETFVTQSNNMLPPDNFQEDPRPVVAHRTSPTNIGLYLLAVAAARDFGWLGLGEAADRLEASFATLDRMEQVNGHFLNWYDTQDLQPLLPRYVSSVDSGNFAGHLIALANSCEAWIAIPLTKAAQCAGVGDALALTRLALGGSAADNAAAGDATALEEAEAHLAAGDLAACLRATQCLCDATSALPGPQRSEALSWAEAARASLASHLADPDAPAALHARLVLLAARARGFVAAMQFGFLVDPERKLLSIGFLVAEGTLDQSCYDLLASESRLASFLAIAKGDAPVAHWFRLGRAVTPLDQGAALISWSGSMFEYLMPSLVMRAPDGSLLASTNRRVVRRQIQYATALGLPWGMSESAFAARDIEFTYQYSNFGVPDLALKRGLDADRVIAPYATALAAMLAPVEAVANFAHLEREGALGSYGYYEALDYTPARVPEDRRVSVVRAYMAHHQGMTMLAIANVALGGIIRTRFHAEPQVQAAELLLQERTPRDVAAAPERAAMPTNVIAIETAELPVFRRIVSPHTATPALHIMSNGRYSVMVSAAGSGYSRWQGRAVTRWREDLTRDDWGSYIFLRDVASDLVWSAGYQPAGRTADSYAATFTEERVEITRRDGDLLTTTEIMISGEDDAEVRRVTLTNTTGQVREVELTSYMELVLAPQADDDAHPVFSKMFVQTEFVAEHGTLLATRRRRAPEEAEMWAAHILVTEGEMIGDLHFETDRAAFLGRARELRDPAMMLGGRPLSGSTGTVLDAIFSLRQRVRIAPGGSARLAFWTLVADTREAVLELVDRHRDRAAFDRAFTLAWTQAQVQLRHLDIRPSEASRFQRLAGHLIYPSARLRPHAEVLRRGAGGPAGLWAHSISGDLPIVVVRVDDTEDIGFVRSLLAAHEYWWMKQLAIDLVFINEKPASYNQDLQLALDAAVRRGQGHPDSDGHTKGSVFLLRTDLMLPETHALLLSVARIVLVSRRGTLAAQVDRLDEPTLDAPAPLPVIANTAEAVDAEPTLEFANGLGGFAADGREYVTVLRGRETTPAPWTNIIANAAFGCQITADGGGYAWSRNSRENQLTPWSNDPVSDRPGEAIYLRDRETGAVWGPTPLPVRDPAARYEVQHGMGYSRFRSHLHGIALDLTCFVPLDDAVKISRLVIRNTTARTRQLSLTHYVEWVLGPSRPVSTMHIMTEHAADDAAVLARNAWNTAFGPTVGFAAMPGRAPSVTGDRREFLGRNGTLGAPAALLHDTPLSGRVGAGLDPCAALQESFELKPGEATSFVLLLGAAGSATEVSTMTAKYAEADLDAVLAGISKFWDGLVGNVQVKTPDRAMDIMLNGWLIYQTLACRIWARSGFYQAGGAFGFRDQLQDGMALATVRPDLTRAHLLRAAGRQFPEGDVQHWWLPPSGQGVRTRISDDRIWLANAAIRYVTVTDDTGVLDETVPFLEGPLLTAHRHDAYFLPTVSANSATLYEHCALGLEAAFALGVHGLPLIGTGDWNDGMSRVGEAGAGESVWLAWFLYATLLDFAPIAEARGQFARAALWRAHAAALQIAIEAEAWDGAWYRRGYFDNGTPLGSVSSSECRIDAIAQSWGVISGAADPARATRAMAAVDEQLIRRHDRLALLFTPPFDQTPLDPGYIKGYPPGLRENGGQYTHAALWSVIALAMQGEGDRAGALFAMLNPINHALNEADVHRYKVEPYVVAADIYSASGHVGRGGWTWYTGSAGWMYRAGLESLLGLHRESNFLRLEPCIPRAWPGYEIKLRHGAGSYTITVENPNGGRTNISQAWIDGTVIADRPVRLRLADDGQQHIVRLILGDQAPEQS